ncbi:MAG: RecQ family ATP-dependent DNA helicase [Sphaerochaetaceae bacterium]|nr:RecQ family ATP-dependent DNA helicase [Sphaerochaetaceae bacterium]
MQRIMEQEEMSYVRHQIVVLPTGTGKSICFLLPAILCKGITVVVYPLLALMNDQMARLAKADIPCICIRGGQSKEVREDLFKKLGKNVRILVITAESLQNPYVLQKLRNLSISLFVVDEAHVISQWGKDFRPAYIGLSSVVRELRPHQILAFTATASDRTLKDIRNVLFPTKPLIVSADPDRPNILYGSYPTLNRVKGVIDLVTVCTRPALVFCRTRQDTKTIATYLCMERPEIPVRYYHAGLSPQERETLENWFMDSHDGVLVATSAYGLGMDKGNVRTVIHHSLPQTVEEYLQESGRAGRDGDIAWAWVIVTSDDRLANVPYSPLVEVFLNNSCRRMTLLKLIGYEKQECYGCDVCFRTQVKDMDGDYAIRTLARLWPFRFDAQKAASILCSSRSIKTTGLEARANPLYGSLPGWNTRMLSKTIKHLAGENNPYPILRVRFLGFGELLYPSNTIYNRLAKFLRRIDHGYRWIVRKTRRLKKSIRKIRRP